MLAGKTGQPAPERLVRQFRGDVVIEDLVEPEAGDGDAAEAEHCAEDDDGGQQQNLGDAPHGAQSSTRI